MVNALGVGFAVIAAFCLAGQALTVRLATRDTASSHVLLIILLINAVIIVPLAVGVHGFVTMTATAIFAFVAAGIVSTMLGRALFYGGVERVGAARAEPLKASMPLYATILAVVFLDEVVGGIQFIGVVLIVSGIVIISWDGATRDASAVGSADWVGLTFPLMGAFLFGVEPIFAVVGFNEGTPVLVGLAIKIVVATGVLGFYLAVRNELPNRKDLPIESKWIVVAGLANSGFLFAYYGGLWVARVSVVVPIMQTSPLIVAAVSAVFFRELERVTALLVVGSAIVVTGAIAVTVFG